MTTFTPPPFSAALALALSALPAVAAADDVGGFRVKMSKWVETRQLVSQEKSEWEAEQETLRATRELLAREKKVLEAEIAELEESGTAVDDERRDLLLERADYQRASAALEGEIRALEQQVLTLAPKLPAPLQDMLEVLLVQIPEDPDTTRLQLGPRLMNVLGVLAQAEKWNGTASFVGETREVKAGSGEKVAVRTLYWGLGQAIYVDAHGETAGVGRPGPEGWVFVDDEDLAADAQLLLDIYEGNVDAIEFVQIPVEAK